jgi:hypothetical protein
MSRQRLDWVDFFRSVRQPHGLRLRLAGIDATAPESLTAEKRLVRIVRALATGEPFALRRSFASGPAIIDCVFRNAAAADDLAGEIGAASIKPPLGWATARELVADGPALRRLKELSAEPSRPYVRKGSKADGLPPSIPPILPATMPGVVAAISDPVGEARSRLANMPLEEQAAALFRAMMEDSRES